MSQRRIVSSSFGLDVGCLDHLGPFYEFDLDVLGEFFRRACDRFEAKHSKPLPDVGQRHDLDDLAMKEGYDRFWFSGCYDETLPIVAVDLGIAELRRGGQSRQSLRARLARHREAAQSALYHLLCSRRRGGEAYLRMSPDRGTYCQAGAVEGHMHKIEAEREAERFADQMSRRSGSRRCVAVLTGIGLDECDQVLERMRRYRRVNGDYQSGESCERNQIEVLAELIRDLAV